ncbi:MAG: hypothetical protein WD845_14355 [Pirellulales bacterium]
MHFAWLRSAGRWWLAHVLVSVLALSVAAGTPGCWSSKSSEQAREDLKKLKEKEKPKPPFDAVQVVTEPNERTYTPRKEIDAEKEKESNPLPTDGDLTYDEDLLALRGNVKPGHWTGVLVTTTANEGDFVGELVSAPQNSSQQPIELESSPFYLQTTRPAALPKEQRKTLETMFFAPRVIFPDARQSTWMTNQLRDRRRGTIAWTSMAEQFRHMPSYQYYLCVLARDASRYRYFNVLDSVQPPLAMPLVVADEQHYYRVLTPRPEAPLALPSRALAWTSIAYVVWDDMLPAVLSPEQQQAMLDWLHWGGGLIISGPRTLDSMRGTFLEPYLPALSEETTELDQASLAALNENWSLTGGNNGQATLAPTEPWAGIKFAKHPAAEYLAGTGELVVERRVGRGRIVATAFRLSERELLNWRSFDSFVNGCLLRRLPRHYVDRIGEFEFIGKDDKPVPDSFDARHVSALRIYSRDAERPHDEAESKPAPPPDPNVVADPFTPTPTYTGFEAQDRLEKMKGESGVGGWNDYSAVSTVAREVLRQAAGISVPNRSFVLWMVGLYLLIVVPINWLVFRLVGRVELAWLAVPVLAIGWGVVVVWLAQLDIGFARAETEVGVLEVQSGYPRAHLTRYMALYTSLSTTYDVHFADPSALAQPFARDRAQPLGQGRSTVSLRSAADQQLTDFVVSSNSTEMVHSEQIVNLKGAIDWRQPADAAPVLENNTLLTLSGVAVIRRRATEPGDVSTLGDAAEATAEGAWIGDLAPGAKAEVVWRALDEARAEIAAGREAAEVTAKKPPDGALSLRRLIDLAEEPRTLEPGDVRLVGWYDQGLPGVEADPSAPQGRRKTLVLVNLRFGDAPASPDRNLRTVAQPVEE